MPSIISYARMEDKLNGATALESHLAKDFSRVIDLHYESRGEKFTGDRLVELLQLSLPKYDLPIVLASVALAISKYNKLDTKQKSDLSKYIYSEVESMLDPLKSLIKS